jgi:four helix bundle protein
MVANPVKEKSFGFAVRIIKLATWLKKNNHFELSQQIIRAGTSIGANIEEALAGQSRKDFASKMAIASKEARETNYWLRLLIESGVLSNKMGNSLLGESQELVKMLTSIVKTSQSPKIIKNSKSKIEN